MDENYNNNSRQRRRLNEEGDDRLSSLPDSILTEILSFLPIDSAAATSILSHRWRYLWTGVTCFEFNFKCSEKSKCEIYLSTAIDILSKLTSPKLRVVRLMLHEASDFNISAATESFFREIFRRNVDQVIFDAGWSAIVPDACFHSRSMDTLEVKAGWLSLNFPENISIYLPNLRKLVLAELMDLHPCFQTMFECCPLLEDLDLSFDSRDYAFVHMPEYANPVINVSAPNLKSFKIYVIPYSYMQHFKIYIDAPKLIKLDIKDWNSFYYFVRNPTALVNVRIDIRGKTVEEHENEWYEGTQTDELGNEWYEGARQTDYHRHMFRFFQGLSSVRNLKLFLQSRANVFTDLNSANLPVFSNLVRLETNCLKDLLCSLQCFPNLEHLKMTSCVDEQRNWCAPDSVADCLVNKIKTIQIRGLEEDEDDKLVLGYILHNATVLDELHVHCEPRKMQYGSEHEFCKSLFDLPRSSSTCEVVYSSFLISKASSKDYLEYGIQHILSCCTTIKRQQPRIWI